MGSMIFAAYFFNDVDQKNESVHAPSIPSSFAQEMCWKTRLTRTNGMVLHFEILVGATLLLLPPLRYMPSSERSHQNLPFLGHRQAIWAQYGSVFLRVSTRSLVFWPISQVYAYPRRGSDPMG